MRWIISNRFSRFGCEMADRHYSRQSSGSNQFVAPGRCLVLEIRSPAPALWVSRWPKFADHKFGLSWECTLFRNEGAGLSSELIREALQATRWKWGAPPETGMLTFVDPGSVRRKRDPGRCFIKAGFKHIGQTKIRKILAFRLEPERVPPALAPRGTTMELFDVRA